MTISLQTWRRLKEAGFPASGAYCFDAGTLMRLIGDEKYVLQCDGENFIVSKLNGPGLKTLARHENAAEALAEAYLADLAENKA